LTGVRWIDSNGVPGQSRTAGPMVASGALRVHADVLGIPCTRTLNIDIRRRTGDRWSTPVHAVEDADPSWGAAPYGYGEALGWLRDRETDSGCLIVPQTEAGDWSAGVCPAEVRVGPCRGIWYVASESLMVDQETVINKYLKADGPAPGDAMENWYTRHNESGGCLESVAADFVQAVRNHEFRGTPSVPGSLDGHFGRIEHFLLVHVPPGRLIEDVVGLSRTGVLDAVNHRLLTLEMELSAFAADGPWSDVGPNWGSDTALGSGGHTRFDDVSHSYYDGCDFGPHRF
jgi:hypothetical protein